MEASGAVDVLQASPKFRPSPLEMDLKPKKLQEGCEDPLSCRRDWGLRTLTCLSRMKLKKMVEPSKISNMPRRIQ